MSQVTFLSMAKAIQYLGDAASAQQLLATLQSTLESDMPQLTSALQTENFEVLQKIWHQLKGFAPVFCQDALVAEIARTESLCKHIASHQEQDAALSACELLQSSLQALQLEAAAHILRQRIGIQPGAPAQRRRQC